MRGPLGVVANALLFACVLASGCGDDGSSAGGSAGSGAETSGGGGAGQAGGLEGGGGDGGTGGQAAASLDELLARLREDPSRAMFELADERGFPIETEEGHLLVSLDPDRTNAAGAWDDWQVTAMNADAGFWWLTVPAAPGDLYKFTDGESYSPDPYSRGFGYDDFGEFSQVPPASRHLERWFSVPEGPLAPRTVRVLVPEGRATHFLVMHDGQNLFDPSAPWGGWRASEAAPSSMMLIGIDNTADRMGEYTQVPDVIDGSPLGGEGDAYADYVALEVLPKMVAVYGAPDRVGVLGSSLGGLISLHLAYRHPETFDFVGSMSGTLGWGSIGPHTGETVIERFAEIPKGPYVVYLDSGGDGPCADLDADGIEDDGDGSDNYCETAQMLGVLSDRGFVLDDDLVHVHELGAAHDEAAWAGRLATPLGWFGSL